MHEHHPTIAGVAVSGVIAATLTDQAEKLLFAVLAGVITWACTKILQWAWSRITGRKL